MLTWHDNILSYFVRRWEVSHQINKASAESGTHKYNVHFHHTYQPCWRHHRWSRHKMAVLTQPCFPDLKTLFKALQRVQTQNGSAHGHISTPFRLFSLSQSPANSTDTKTKSQCSQPCFHNLQTFSLSKHCRQYRRKMAVCVTMFVWPSDFVSQGIKESADTKWQCSKLFCDLQTFFFFCNQAI